MRQKQTTDDDQLEKAILDSVKVQAERYVAPPHLRYRIRAQMAEKPPYESKRSIWPNWSWADISKIVAPVSTVALLVSLVFLGNAPSAYERVGDEVIASHFRSLMTNRLVDVVSTDQHTVKPWFAGKLDFSPSVTDFTKVGYALVGGRVDYIQGRPVAALAYRHGNHVLNLYSWPGENKITLQARSVVKNGFNLISWNDAGMNFWLISDLNKNELSDFQNLVKAEMRREP